MAGGGKSVSGFEEILEEDDFLSLTTVSPEQINSLSTSGNSFVWASQLMSPGIVWDVDHPPDYDSQVFTTAHIDLPPGGVGEVRVWNHTDSEEIHSKRVSTAGITEIGPTSYNPTHTTTDPIIIRIQIRSLSHGSITLKSPLIRFGIGKP